MALTRYQRRSEEARKAGYSSYYYFRQARTRELFYEKPVDDSVTRALEYRRVYGMSITKAAHEAHIAPQRLQIIERQIPITDRLTRPVLMLSYVRNRGIVYVELDDFNASLNGSYLNYVRWMFYEQIPGSKLTRPRDVSNPIEMVKFNNMLRAKGVKGQKFKAKSVYGTRLINDTLVMNAEPDDTDVWLEWELYSGKIREYEAKRTGSDLNPYARR